GKDLLVANGAAETARSVAEVLDGAHPGLGTAARATVLSGYDWAASLRPLDGIMGTTPQALAAE
ncbi:MAG TPA: hypothetical protein VIL69_11750, partial [Roseomonas sp.]